MPVLAYIALCVGGMIASSLGAPVVVVLVALAGMAALAFRHDISHHSGKLALRSSGVRGSQSHSPQIPLSRPSALNPAPSPVQVMASQARQQPQELQ
jgi:hypothetical protein